MNNLLFTQHQQIRSNSLWSSGPWSSSRIGCPPAFPFRLTDASFPFPWGMKDWLQTTPESWDFHISLYDILVLLWNTRSLCHVPCMVLIFFHETKHQTGGCTLGWCELERLLKRRNPQAYYGSMTIPEQLLSKVFGSKMYKFLQNWPQRIGIFTL